MRTFLWIILCLIITFSLFATGNFLNNLIKQDVLTENETIIVWSNVSPSWFGEYYKDENNMDIIRINGELCKEVPCECHKNNPMCLSICYYCNDTFEGGDVA